MFEEKKKVVGYTTGVYDLFHIGHLNLLRNAKGMCDTLIIGCSSDEVVKEMKNKLPVIPFNERVEILEAIPYVDVVVEQGIDDYKDKMVAWEKYKFDILFVGSDWQGTDKWNKIEKDFKKIGVKVVYFPYTRTTSSSKINAILDQYDDER
ncbi:adenylyltransferase/cytidyltransferase family protein [Lentisphaerota bacterium WC36G]|nr:adenylyltransferase/cytidyltransferase family protein [Lentisphaerae bacterium WC36]